MKRQGVVEYAIGTALLAVFLLLALAVLGPAIHEVSMAVSEALADVDVSRAEAPSIDLPEIPETLGALPLSDHAYKHTAEKYNALNLPAMWDSGQCKPKQTQWCPDAGTFKMICSVHDGLDAGIVVSATTGRIVSAFAASPRYWNKIRKGCYDVSVQ